MNSMSMSEMFYTSLKSKRSNKNLILSSALESEKMISPENISSASIKPKGNDYKFAEILTIVIRVEDLEDLLVARKDALKFCQVNCEVVAHTFKPTVEFSDLR